MELSQFVAKIIAIVFISASIAALSGNVSFKKLMENFEKSYGLTFMTGFMTIICGMILIEFHNTWTKDWTVLITIIGWTSVLKGITLIAFPQIIPAFKGFYKNTQVLGVVMMGIGILFGYFGFVI